MTPQLALIIVNYNSGTELRSALQSVQDEMTGREWEAVVVDNVSRDGSEAIVSEFAPNARLIRNTTNLGFGRGINQGVQASSAPLLLFLNPDCRLESGAIASMKDVLDQHPQCAIVGPRILDPDGSEQGSARGDPDMLTGLFGRTGLLRRVFPSATVSSRNVVSSGENGRSVTVDWVSGACMLVRRTPFQDVGGFDQRYFMYWEDADVCRRLRARGHEIRYQPAATAVHKVGQSSRTARAASIKAFHTSAYLYYATHVAPGPLNPKRPLARLLLSARCWVKLRHSKLETQNSNTVSPHGA